MNIDDMPIDLIKSSSGLSLSITEKPCRPLVDPITGKMEPPDEQEWNENGKYQNYFNAELTKTCKRTTRQENPVDFGTEYRLQSDIKQKRVISPSFDRGNKYAKKHAFHTMWTMIGYIFQNALVDVFEDDESLPRRP